jgi:hypothetical protein
LRYVEDYSDDRQKAWCIHCGASIADVPSNRDHVPTKSLLSKALRMRGVEYDRGAPDEFGYLPQVLVCRRCNSGFSEDENYLLCLLHAVMAGSLYPDSAEHPEAAAVLRSNRHVVRALKAGPDGQLPLLDDAQPFAVCPDQRRIERIVVKNARGHAYHEIGEPLLEAPAHVRFLPIESLSRESRNGFESIEAGVDLWPEVGSRMLLRVVEGHGLAGGWIEVEQNRYRYAASWSQGVTVRTVIWNYLATETHWE